MLENFNLQNFDLQFENISYKIFQVTKFAIVLQRFELVIQFVLHIYN